MKYKIEQEGTIIYKDNLFYYTDQNGEIKTPGFTLATDFDESGFALVDIGNGLDKLCYYLNRQLEIKGEGYLANFHFDTEFKGLAYVEKKDGLYYLINKNFETVTEGYKNLFDLKEYARKHYKDLLINHSSTTTQELLEDTNTKTYYKGYNPETNKYVYKNEDGFKSENFDELGEFNDGYAVGISSEEQLSSYFLINEELEIVYGPKAYISDFNNGIALVKEYFSGNYYINTELEQISELDTAESLESKRKYYEEYNQFIHIPLSQYFRGIIDIYQLPDYLFSDDSLDKIIEYEKKQTKYLIAMAKTTEQKNKIKEEAIIRADYIKATAYEYSMSQKNENELINDVDKDLF